MGKRLLSRKYLLTVLGLIALLGLIIISYNGTQVNKTQPPQPSSQMLKPKSATMAKPVKDKPVTGQIIVKFKPQYTKAQINAHLAQYHASIKSTIEGINQTVVSVPAGQEETIMQELQNDPYVVTVQRDYTTHAFFVPNDQGFAQQYAFHNIGQAIQGQNGTAKDDINIEPAWDVTKGNGVKVAILDTGINLNQPDLAGKVIVQKSFISNTVEDGNGHGTHVAGIIAADTNNGIGVAGTCPGCKLIIGKILDNSGAGTTSNAVAGITWAADQGAKIINMSLGTNDTQTASLYNQAVAYAMKKGAVVVAAAGNDGSSQLSYPAAATGVISVAGTDNNDKKASWSDYGTWVKIAAPGKNILSTAPTHSFTIEPLGFNTASPYMYLSGTSMAGPFVAGVAALVSTTQYGTSPQAIINRIYATADKIAGTGTYWAYGRLDAAKAVGPAPTAVVPSSTIITPTLYCVGGAGVPPCATIPPGSSNPSTIPSGTIPSGAAASGAPGGGGGSNPSVSQFPESNTSPSPSISGTPGIGGNLTCNNIQVNNIFYNLSSTKQSAHVKVHIKCHSGNGSKEGKGGDNDHKGGGNNNINPNNGWLSKFIAFLLQLLQQLLQLILQCTGQTPGTPVTTPSISPAVSGSLVPSISQVINPSLQPSTSVSNPAPSSSSVSNAPAPSGGGGGGGGGGNASVSCSNPSQTIPLNPNNAQNGLTLGKYYLSADTWNANGYNITQTVYVCNYNNWYVIAGNMSEAGGVKSYPNVHEDFSNNPQISSFNTITSTFASTSPRSGIYDAAYDIWINNMATEVMIWNESYDQTLNGLNPPGSKQTVSLGGRTYDVYKSGSYIAFKATTPFDSGTVDLLQIFKWMMSQGWIASNSTLGQIDYGIEFVSTNNQNVTFKVTNFSITAN